ncbi:protein of unknown function [Streptococcus equinus]|uniref:DUF4393 domain-containing protein n=1 Tax=Streptococcus equinus TaxID=1335 RepID=UPI0008715175|nr:DUF4393 domain-containing protein [Streptococcus equinus]SCW50818.1 protein of unknown function [Streptococcus equinus]
MTDFKDFLPIISGAIGGATTSGVLNGPIQTLQDWWYVKYGYKASDQAALLKAKQEANVEKLKRDILNEVDQIPIENIQEPKLKILGPALDASRYYIEEEELRKMFAKIIASSLDNRKNTLVHSSFVEILKQLDVLDVKILKYFKDNNNFSSVSLVPLMKMFIRGNSGIRMTLPLIFLTEDFQDIRQNAAALINLERLGLIAIKDDGYISNEKEYDFIKNHPTIITMMNDHPEFELGKSYFSITDLGQNFINICAA